MNGNLIYNVTQFLSNYLAASNQLIEGTDNLFPNRKIIEVHLIIDKSVSIIVFHTVELNPPAKLNYIN